MCRRGWVEVLGSVTNEPMRPQRRYSGLIGILCQADVRCNARQSWRTVTDAVMVVQTPGARRFLIRETWKACGVIQHAKAHPCRATKPRGSGRFRSLHMTLLLQSACSTEYIIRRKCLASVFQVAFPFGMLDLCLYLVGRRPRRFH